MKWIRWNGLIAFFIISAILLVFWHFLIDILIERRIEKTGTSLVGAKVELDNADLSLFPLGLTLSGVQVTNPAEPMKNAFEVARISFTIDGANLIRKKYIIEEMAVDGVKLNTQRKASGAVGRQKKAESPEVDALKLLTFELPDVKEVLKKEDIGSIKQIEDLTTKIEADKVRFEKQLSALPDEKKIKEYEDRIESLKRSARGLGGIGRAGELLAIKNEIQDQLKRIAALRDEMNINVTNYRKRMEEATSSPGKDAEKIVNKYSFSPDRLTNLSSLFIGGKVREWVDNGLRWRGKVNQIVSPEGKANGAEIQKPLRGKGVDVQFKEYRPLPDFLIRKASVSVNIPAGDIAGLITNITGDQDILGAPMKIRLSGEKLKGLTSALLEGEINRVTPYNPRDIINFTLKGYRLHDFKLTDNKYMLMAIKEALTDFHLKAELKGDSIDANIGSTVRSALIDTAIKGEKNAILETMSSALSGVKAFNFDAGVKGNIKDYKLRLDSDLDRVLSNAVGGILRNQMLAFERSIKADVAEKTDRPIKELNRNFEGLVDVNGLIDERFMKCKELLTKSTRGALPVPKLP
ncbi:MAG: TIGR03545 family protein [Deltaproteobacteria bacterium]|nr:TIGR03545 family protein [Deltaproteobacteria bacterium]